MSDPPSWSNEPPWPSQGGPPPPPPSGGYGPPPYAGAPPPYGGGYPARRTDGNAIAALVLSIVSFVFCPVIPAVVALFLASASKKNIRASGGTLEGESMATAAQAISWIHIGLVVAGFLLVMVILVAGGFDEDTYGMAAILGLS